MHGPSTSGLAQQQPLRQGLELQMQMRSNLTLQYEICCKHRQQLLAELAANGENSSAALGAIRARYRDLCKVRDLEMSYSDLFREKLRFHFHLGRFAVARTLKALDTAPNYRRALAARALLGLGSLSPRMIDIL